MLKAMAPSTTNFDLTAEQMLQMMAAQSGAGDLSVLMAAQQQQQEVSGAMATDTSSTGNQSEMAAKSAHTKVRGLTIKKKLRYPKWFIETPLCFIKVVLEGYRTCPDSHDLSECRCLYDLGRHI